MVIALITGWIADRLVDAGKLPPNPNRVDLPTGYRVGPAIRGVLRSLKPGAENYRHLAKEEQQRLGFANSVILATSYVPGATRHPLLDTLVLGAFAAMILGLLAHGLGRFLTRGKRRSEPAPTTEKNDPGTGTNGGSHG